MFGNEHKRVDGGLIKGGLWKWPRRGGLRGWLAKEQVNGVQQKFLGMLIKSFGNRILALVIKNKKIKQWRLKAVIEVRLLKVKMKLDPSLRINREIRKLSCLVNQWS